MRSAPRKGAGQDARLHTRIPRHHSPRYGQAEVTPPVARRKGFRTPDNPARKSWTGSVPDRARRRAPGFSTLTGGRKCHVPGHRSRRAGSASLPQPPSSYKLSRCDDAEDAATTLPKGPRTPINERREKDSAPGCFSALTCSQSKTTTWWWQKSQKIQNGHFQNRFGKIKSIWSRGFFFQSSKTNPPTAANVKPSRKTQGREIKTEHHDDRQENDVPPADED